jgi:hypothetical protein
MLGLAAMVGRRNPLATLTIALALAATLAFSAVPATAELDAEPAQTGIETTDRPPCNDGIAIVDVGPVEAGLTDWCRPYVQFTTSSTVPACGNGGEVSLGPATAGYGPYCQTYYDVDEPTLS